MSPLRERAIEEISVLPEEQLMFVLSMLEGLKKVIQVHTAEAQDPLYSEGNQRFLAEGIQALNEGRGVEHELIEV